MQRASRLPGQHTRLHIYWRRVCSRHHKGETNHGTQATMDVRFARAQSLEAKNRSSNKISQPEREKGPLIYINGYTAPANSNAHRLRSNAKQKKK